MSQNFVAGLISGIDTTSLIDAMVAARSGGVQLAEQRRAAQTAQLTAWKSFEATLLSFQVSADRLAERTLWNDPVVQSGDEEVLSVSADSSAALDGYDFFVRQLAQAHQVRSVAFGSRDELVGTGTLSITVGDATTDLDIQDGTSVADLVDRINDADLGATATLVRSEESGVESYWLVLTSDETGGAASVSVASSLAGGTDPVLADEVRAAQDAILEFGGEGGLQLHSATNVFTDVVDGLDVTVHRAQEEGDPPVRVDVGRNTEGITQALGDFVAQFNAVQTFVNGQYRYDPEVGTRPPLMGDGQLTLMASRLRASVFARVEGLPEGATFRSLLDAGLSVGSNGTLSLDESKLADAMEEDFDAVADLFRIDVDFDVPGLSLLGAPEGLDLGGRSLSIDVEQAATRAQLTGALFDLGSGGLVIDDTNDTFRIEVDGFLSEELTLRHGTYADGDELARAISSAVAGSDELGPLGVIVSFEGDAGTSGRLVFSSNRYGTDGTLRLQNAGGNFFADLGLTDLRNVEAAGKDVIAVVDGVRVTGSGRVLRIAESDSEELAGLELRIALEEGDVPATVVASFTEGMARGVGRMLDQMTDSAEGTLKRLNDTLQARIDQWDRDIDGKMDQLDRYRQRLVRRYASLEATLGQLQSQGNMLSAQLGTAQTSFRVNGS